VPDWLKPEGANHHYSLREFRTFFAADELSLVPRLAMTHSRSKSSSALPATGTLAPVYWRAEGSLLELGAMRPVGFFTWNSQSFQNAGAPPRHGRMALARPFTYAANRTFATRFLHTCSAASAAIGWTSSARILSLCFEAPIAQRGRREI